MLMPRFFLMLHPSLTIEVPRKQNEVWCNTGQPSKFRSIPYSQKVVDFIEEMSLLPIRTKPLPLFYDNQLTKSTIFTALLSIKKRGCHFLLKKTPFLWHTIQSSMAHRIQTSMAPGIYRKSCKRKNKRRKNELFNETFLFDFYPDFYCYALLL